MKFTDTGDVIIGNIKIIEIKKGHIYEAKRLIKNGTYRVYVRFNAKDMTEAIKYAFRKAYDFGYVLDFDYYLRMILNNF